jgi:hypothetical protein
VKLSVLFVLPYRQLSRHDVVNVVNRDLREDLYKQVGIRQPALLELNNYNSVDYIAKALTQELL